MRYFLGDDGPRSLVLSGLAAGAAWGTKAPGVVFVPPLIALVLARIFLAREPLRARLRDAALFITSCPKLNSKRRNGKRQPKC